MSTAGSNAALDINYAGQRAETATVAEDPVVWGLRLTAWLQLLMVASLMALLFWPNLRRLWDKTNPFYGEPNWGHAFFVPVIGLYYLYLNREQLRAAGVSTAWSGLPILLGGILVFVWGIWPGQNDFVKDLGMVIAIFGIATLLCGWRAMKVAWFPVAFLICALPWPGLFYSQIAGPLQRLAAEVAVLVLKATGVGAMSSGTKIIMEGGRTLNVAEACAGLRSLMTFISVAAAVAFLTPRALWQRLILVASAVPIAIFCNVMRVSGQGLLDHYVSTSFSEGFAHSFVGLVMLIPAFFLILLVGYILDHLFIEEVERKPAYQTKASAQASASPRSVSASPSIQATRDPRSAARAPAAPVAPASPSRVAGAQPAPKAPAPSTELRKASPSTAPKPAPAPATVRPPAAPRPAAPPTPPRPLGRPAGPRPTTPPPPARSPAAPKTGLPPTPPRPGAPRPPRGPQP